ncbi:MAG: hypothetical protein EAX95_11215 [Candidatus Thorarchaeota archaeon]|nr:hypothetical protein [Candidatus Thorarchaeota archaeon]
MIPEIALLIGIYSIWILILVASMVSTEEVSLTIATLPFIVTFPIAMILAALMEVFIPGIFTVNLLLTVVVGVLIFIRWVMAIVGE